MNKILSISLLSMALIVAGQAVQLKSGFESGDFSGWNTQGEGWSVYKKAASEGKMCALVKVTKGEAAGVKAAAKLIPNADPGSIIKVELNVAGKVKSQSSKLTASVVCVDSSGQILREVKKIWSSPSAQFTKLALPELIVPSGTVEAYLMLVVEIPLPAKGNEWWRFDGVVIDVK